MKAVIGEHGRILSGLTEVHQIARHAATERRSAQADAFDGLGVRPYPGSVFVGALLPHRV